MTEPLPDEIDDTLWAEACRRADAIRRFLLSSSGESTVAAIADLASELQVSQATTYRLLRRFRADGTVMSLIETKRGRRTGHRALDAPREEIIEKAIRTYYLKPTRPTVSQLVRDIKTDCVAEGLKPPHLDLPRDCAAPLTTYRVAKENTDGISTNRRISCRSSTPSVDERLAA